MECEWQKDAIDAIPLSIFTLGVRREPTQPELSNGRQPVNGPLLCFLSNSKALTYTPARSTDSV